MKTRDEFAEILNSEGLNGIGVELGVQTGEYSETILKKWNGKELILIDIWKEIAAELYCDVANVSQDKQRDNLAKTFDKIYPFGDKATIIRADGNRAVSLFADNTLDFVYIDANHSYNAVTHDIALWYPKVKKGGYLCGHDYPYIDVKKAVDEFCVKNNYTLLISTDDWSSWFIKK